MGDKATREVARPLGRNIALARTQAGLQQTYVATQMGVTQETLSRWERGRILPPINQLLQLARILGVDAAWLLTRGAMEAEEVPQALRGQQGVPDSLREQIKQLSPERRRELTRKLVQDVL